MGQESNLTAGPASCIDYPAKLIDQIRWLEDIGFRSVDVIWKYYNFSVYGGIK